MISWIQRTFQNHFRTVFAVLLGVTIISFVFVYSASSGIGRSGPPVREQPFFGYNLGSGEDVRRISSDAALSVYLQYGYASPDSSQLQEYGFQRVAALALANAQHLPAPTKDELAKYVTTLRAFQGEDGQFDVQRYNAFRDQLASNPQMHEADVSRVLSDDFRCEQTKKIMTGPGYVLAGDVARQLTRADSKWTITVATIDYASYSPAITVREDELAKFFASSSSRYEVAPRTVVDYLEFKAADHLGEVSVNDAALKAYYEANKERFPKPEAKKDDKASGINLNPAAPTPAQADADFAAVRPQVEAALRLELAERQATKAANDVSLALYEKKLTPSTPDFAAFLSERKLAAKSLPPLSRTEAPAGTNWPASVSAEAFKLDEEHPVSDPIAVGGGNVVVLVWKQLLPSYQPTLAQVHDKVAADYQENEKRKRFIEAGRTLRTAIEARLKAGESFDKAATAAAAAQNLKVETKTYPAFARREPPQDLDPTALGTLEHLEKGQVSDMAVREKGYVVYVQDKAVPALSDSNPQYASIKTQLMQASIARNESLYLSEMVAAELAKSTPVTTATAH